MHTLYLTTTPIRELGYPNPRLVWPPNSLHVAE